MKHAITSVVIIIAISLFGCSESCKVNDIFSKAEQLMDVKPDSALLLLQGVNTDELSTKEGKARHALLLSQAYDKNYIDLTNDSLINIAVEYYNGKRKYKRYDMLSHYYKARVQANSKAYTKSIVSASVAEKIAKEIEDYFYLGLIYQCFSANYNESNNSHEELRYIKMAHECFKLAGRRTHILSSFLCIGIAHVANRNNEAAIRTYKQLLNTIDIEKDTKILGRCLHHYANVLSIDRKFSEAKDMLLQLYNIPQHKWNINDFCNLARAYNKENKRDSVLYYIDRAKEVVTSEVDSVFIYRVMYEMKQSEKDYEGALWYMKKMNAIQDSVTDATLEQSLIRNHRDYFQQELQLANEKAKQNKRTFIFSTITLISFVCILLLMALYYYEITKRKNAEIVHIFETIRDANNIINNQGEELKETRQQIAKVFSSQFALLDELLNTYLDHEGSNRVSAAVLKEVEKRIAGFRNQKKLDELKKVVNENMNNIADRLQQQITTINNNELILFLYLCAQFSPRVITLFMSDKLENIYNKKSRLKRKIQNSNATDKEEFLRLF